MNKKDYETNKDYILDVLEEEKERLLEKLGDILSDEARYLFYRYLSVIDVIKKSKID